MAFGFQLPTYGQKKKDEEEKKLPMQSKVPMQSNIPSNKTTPTVQTQTSNRAGGIPTKPMMSYNIEGTILPGVADDKATMILDYAKKTAKTPEEEKLLVKDMHTEAIRIEQKQMFNKDRTEMKAQVMKEVLKEPDPVKQKKIGISIKLAEFADTVRDWSISQGIDPNDPDDQSVSTKFIEANPQLTDTFTDFVNGNITNVDLGKKLGLIQEEVAPVEEGNVVQNIGEGMVSYAGGIPKIIGETGILDKPLMAIANKIRSAMGKRELTPEEQELLAYSKTASGSQVGGNPESAVAKGVEDVMSAGEIIAGVPMLAKGIVKIGDKIVAKKLAKKALIKDIANATPEDVIKNKKARQIREAIQPKMTQAEMESRKGVKKGLTNTVEYLPKKEELKQIQLADDIGVKPGNLRIDNKTIVKDALSQEAENFRTIVKDNPVTHSYKEVSSKIDKIERGPEIVGDMEKTFVKVKNKFMEFVKNEKGNKEGLLNARQKFDQYVQDWFPNLYTSDKQTPMRKVIKDIRNIANDMLDKGLTDDVAKKSLAKQTDMYRIIDNINTDLEKKGSNAISRWMKNNPTKAKLIKTGVGATVVGGTATAIF